MTKIMTIAMAALLSVGVVGATLQPAEAGKRERRIAAGIALGVLGTALILNETRRDRRHYRQRHYRAAPRRYHRRVYQPRRVYQQRRTYRLSHAHTNWCYNRYRSYREWDNTFQPYHGPRRACYSPYS